MNVNLAKNGFISLIAGISIIATSTQLHAGQPIEKIEQGIVKQLNDCLGANHEITTNFQHCTNTMKDQLNAFFNESNKQKPHVHVMGLMANVTLLKTNVVDKIQAILDTDATLDAKKKEVLVRLKTRLSDLCTNATQVCTILEMYINQGCSTSLSDLIGLADKLSSKKNLLPKNLRDLPLLDFKQRLVTRFSCK